MRQTGVLVVYGAGGHGRVVADIALELGFELGGFIDDAARPGTTVLVPSESGPILVLGDGTWFDSSPSRALTVGLGIGNNYSRKRIFDQLTNQEITVTSLVHPSAVVSRFALAGPGTVVMALATVNPCASIGRGAIINTGSVVEHDVAIGDFAHVSPHATLAGGARIGPFSQLGAGATILSGISVGENCLVGAGAVVTSNVRDGAVVAGVPARFVRDNSR